MKTISKAIAFTTASLLSGIILANDDAALTSADCESVQSTAAGIMSIRQKNYPIAELMSEFVGEHDYDIRKAIVEAYERPYFKDEQLAQNEVDEFSNKWALRCYQLIEQTSGA